MTGVQWITPADEAAARGEYDKAARYRAQDRERAAAAGDPAVDYAALCVRQATTNLADPSPRAPPVNERAAFAELQRALGVSAKPGVVGVMS
jgi:hypothetical protein